MASRPWDVIVVGAGPAGSTAAALLAQRGQRVVLLEKERFPRFHIGESLLPAGLAVHARIGLEPRAEAFVYKAGAEFVCETTGRTRGFHFDEALPGCAKHAWHVERSLFDALLRDRAAALGADVRHGEQVLDVDLADDRVRVRTGSGEVTGRFLVDATGMDRLLALKTGTVRPYRGFGQAAVFTHFEGVRDEVFAELGPGNDLRVLLRADGWGWIIPLPGRRLSIGLVSQKRLAPGHLDAGLLQGPLARRWTAGATRLATRVVSNFSYRNSAPSGVRFAAIGDAACFLDPVFSSGVMLAMQGAEALADQLGPALEQGREAAPDLMQSPCARMDRAYRTFEALIDRFYNTRFAETVFLGDTEDRPMRQGVLSVLAGDVFRKDNPFQELLLRARPAGHGVGSAGMP
jgi:flavin-dependent dehydrogenase